MPANTIWKGVIEFGGVAVPVRFYSAIEERSLHFNLLDERDRSRIKQEMVHPDTGTPVANEEIKKGYKIGEDRYVVLAQADLDLLQPRESRSIRVEAFVPQDAISHQWYERAYYLGPDGKANEYPALAAALSDVALTGIARWAMRKRRYIGSLQAHHGFLIMYTLHYEDEVISAASLPTPEGRTFAAKELALAEQLVAALHTDFDPSQYHDEYRERVMELVEAKAKGQKPRLRIARAPRTTDSENLASVLSASLKRARKRLLSA